jgi:hypothetical protein
MYNIVCIVKIFSSNVDKERTMSWKSIRDPVPIRITGAHAQAVKQSSVFLKANPELKSRPGSG